MFETVMKGALAVRVGWSSPLAESRGRPVAAVYELVLGDHGAERWTRGWDAEESRQFVDFAGGGSHTASKGELLWARGFFNGIHSFIRAAAG